MAARSADVQRVTVRTINTFGRAGADAIRPGMSSLPWAPEKGPQVHSKRRVVKTASKISALWPASSDVENGYPGEFATSPFVRHEEHMQYVFSRDVHSAGIVFMRVKLDATADIVAAPHLSLPVGAQCLPAHRRLHLCFRSDLLGVASAAMSSRPASPAKTGVSVGPKEAPAPRTSLSDAAFAGAHGPSQRCNRSGNPCSSRGRSKIRLAVWRCLLE